MLLLLLGCARAFDDSAQWMRQDWTSIANRTLASLALPGTHDSGTYNLSLTVASGLLNADLLALLAELQRLGVSVPEEVIRNWAKSQTTSILGQLHAGARYIDFRVIEERGELWTQHLLLSNDPISVMLQQVAVFLNSTTHECLLLDFTLNFVSARGAKRMHSLILQYFGSALYSRVPATPDAVGWPTLAQQVSSGRRVVVLIDGALFAGSTAQYFWPRELVVSLWANSPSPKALVQSQESFFWGFDRSADKNLVRKLQWVLTENEKMVFDALFEPSFHPRSLLQLSDAANVLLVNFSVTTNNLPIGLVMVDNFLASAAVDVARNLNTISCSDSDPLCSQWLQWGYSCAQLGSRCARMCSSCPLASTGLPGLYCAASSASCQCKNSVCLSRNPRASGALCVANFQCQSATCTSGACL